MSLTVIASGMYAGKTDELLRRVRRAQHAKKAVALLKPIIDTRYSESDIVSHNGLRVTATPVSADALSEELKRLKADFYAIDEIQFFTIDQRAIDIIDSLADKCEIVVAGLDRDFTGRPFESTKELMAIADSIIKFPAVCDKCGADAMRTQRMVDGREATSGVTVQIGGHESYEARCRQCFIKGE